MANLAQSLQIWQNMYGDRSIIMFKKALGQYDYTEDPAYYRDIQSLQQNPTPANANAVYGKWGKYLDVDKQTFMNNATGYVEGTPQWYETQELKRTHEKGEATQDSTIKVTNTVNQAKTAEAEGQINIWDERDDTGYAQAVVETEASNLGLQQLENQFETKKINYSLEQGLPQQIVDTEMQNLITEESSSSYKQQENEILIDNVEELTSAKITNILNQAEQSSVNVKISQENLEKLRTQNKYLEDQILNDMTLQEQKIYNNKVKNEILDRKNRMGRELYDTEIELVKRDLLIKKAQLERINLSNESQEITNKIKSNDLWKMQQERNFLEDLTEEERRAAMLGTGSGTGSSSDDLSPNRIVGSTADKRNVYSTIGGGFIVRDPYTGQPRSLSEKEKEGTTFTTDYNEVMVNPYEIMWNDPIIRNSVGEETILNMAKSGPTQMTLTDAQRFINTIKNEFDYAELIRTETFSERARPDQTFGEAMNDYTPTPEPEPEPEPESNLAKIWGYANDNTYQPQTNKEQIVVKNFLGNNYMTPTEIINEISKIPDSEFFNKYEANKSEVLKILEMLAG